MKVRYSSIGQRARLPRGFLPGSRMAFSAPGEQSRGDTLIVIFLRGAADGLNMVIPHADEDYHRLRPGLRLPRPDDPRAEPERRVIDLDGFFGLHPALRPLLPAWQAGQFACVQACGAPDESRSHFKAMELMERGVSGESGPATGWLGRHLASSGLENTSPLRAVGFGDRTPRSLYGPIPASALQSIADFHLGSSAGAKLMAQALAVLYQGSTSTAVLGQETLSILQTLEKLDPAGYRPAGSSYPDTDFGQQLKQVAMLIKSEVGLEAAAIDLGGWDTHFAQGVQDGIMPNLLQDLSGSLAAFHSDLEGQMDRITVAVMTEFGRRAYENASLGTDHGRGGLMLLLGGSIAGGQVITRWPRLSPQNLVGPGDLAVTTDYRDVLGEILSHRMQNQNLELVFPGYNPRPIGILKQTSREKGINK